MEIRGRRQGYSFATRHGVYIDAPVMTTGRSRRQTVSDIFRWPLWLGALMAVGMASALFGDGGWDVLSWLAMAIPIAVIARKALAKAG